MENIKQDSFQKYVKGLILEGFNTKDNIHAGQNTVATWRFRVVSGRPRAYRNYLI